MSLRGSGFIHAVAAQRTHILIVRLFPDLPILRAMCPFLWQSGIGITFATSGVATRLCVFTVPAGDSPSPIRLFPMDGLCAKECVLIMLRLTNRAESRPRNGREARKRGLRLESLEPRMLLHSGGIAWNSPDLTISFAPEGTQIASHASELFSHFGSIGEQQAWQSSIVRAFATWAQQINATITVVDDSGDPFGVSGATQGDSKFGDIRVGALPLSSDVIAMSVPHDEIVSGTWAGDLLFNSKVDLASLDDLFAVALHEAGHVFGLDHSDDPNSPMYVHGIPDAIEPAPHDIEELQKLYCVKIKARESEEGIDYPDTRSDGDHDNEGCNPLRLDGADVMLVSPHSTQIARYETFGVIDSPNDVDYFRLEPSEFDVKDSEYLSVVIRSTDPEGVVLNATVYNKDEKVLPSRVLAREAGLLVVQANDADPTERLFLKVETAHSNENFRSASYDLTARFIRQPFKRNTIASGSLNSENTTRFKPLHVRQTQLFHFSLAAEASQSETTALAWAVLKDSSGNAVYRVVVRPGETRSAGTVLLQPGDYRFEFQTQTSEGTELPEISYALWGQGITIPIGPGILDPTESPVLACGTPSAESHHCNPVDVAITDPVILPHLIPVPSEETVANPSSLGTDADWW